MLKKPVKKGARKRIIKKTDDKYKETRVKYYKFGMMLVNAIGTR